MTGDACLWRLAPAAPPARRLVVAPAHSRCLLVMPLLRGVHRLCQGGCRGGLGKVS